MKLIEQYRKVRDRALIITPYDCEYTDVQNTDIEQLNFWKFQGVKRFIADDNVIKRLNDRINYFRNGLLLLDDCRFYIEAKIEKDLHRFLIARKQRSVDIIVAAHGFTEVPPKFFTFAKSIVLHKTNDNINERKRVLNKFQELKQLQQKVNNHKDFHYHEVFNLI